MKTKLFEVRDAMTFIVVMATKLVAGNQQEEYLLRRVGYKSDDKRVVVTKLSNLETHDRPDLWTDITMRTIHSHLEESFDTLGFGSVLDAEFLRGESDKPKHSERGTPLEILNTATEVGMTLKEFADGMKEASEIKEFVESIKGREFMNDSHLAFELYVFKKNLEWVTAIVNSRTNSNYNQKQIQNMIVDFEEVSQL